MLLPPTAAHKIAGGEAYSPNPRKRKDRTCTKITFTNGHQYAMISFMEESHGTVLKVYAMEDRNSYPTKRKITNEQMDALNVFRNDILGKWNYTIKPR